MIPCGGVLPIEPDCPQEGDTCKMVIVTGHLDDTQPGPALRTNDGIQFLVVGDVRKATRRGLVVLQMPGDLRFEECHVRIAFRVRGCLPDQVFRPVEFAEFELRTRQAEEPVNVLGRSSQAFREKPFGLLEITEVIRFLAFQELLGAVARPAAENHRRTDGGQAFKHG